MLYMALMLLHPCLSCRILLDTLKKDLESSSEVTTKMKMLAQSLLAESHELAQIIVTCSNSMSQHHVYQVTGVRAAHDRTVAGFLDFLREAKTACGSKTRK